MMSRLVRYLFILVCLLSVSGCKLLKLKEKQPTDYQTILADPRYDTELADREHAQALKIIDRYHACEASERACLEDPQVRLVSVFKGYLDCAQGNLERAEEHLNTALVADVKHGPAHNTLGTVYFLQGRHYLAAWEYEYAARLMPEQIEPLYNLGMVYEAAEKLLDAIDYYEMAHALQPRNPFVTGSLVRARMRNGETADEVRSLLQDIIFDDTRPPWVAWARDQLGLHPPQEGELSDRPADEDSGSKPEPRLIRPDSAEPSETRDRSAPFDPYEPFEPFKENIPLPPEPAPADKEPVPAASEVPEPPEKNDAQEAQSFFPLNLI